MSQQKRNREILTYPNPHLLKAAQRVERFDEELSELFDEMCGLMHASDGVGLAATQVGEPIQLLVLSNYVFLPEEERKEILDNDGDMGPNVAVINPEVIDESSDLINDYEGCLSFPEVYIKVKRPRWVKIKAQNLQGEVIELEGEGLGARAILHEMDHLTGKVMTDHLGFLDRQKALKDHQRVQKNRRLKAEREAEETSTEGEGVSARSPSRVKVGGARARSSKHSSKAKRSGNKKRNGKRR